MAANENELVKGNLEKLYIETKDYLKHLERSLIVHGIGAAISKSENQVNHFESVEKKIEYIERIKAIIEKDLTSNLEGVKQAFEGVDYILNKTLVGKYNTPVKKILEASRGESSIRANGSFFSGKSRGELFVEKFEHLKQESFPEHTQEEVLKNG